MPEHEPLSREDEDELGPKEGEGIDEVEGVDNEQLERAHRVDAAREKAAEEEPA